MNPSPQSHVDGAQVGAAPEVDVTRVVLDHGRFVWLTLQRFGVRGTDLEDVTQEVFLVVHQRIHTWEGAGRITSWLYGICLKVAAAHRRRAWVRREVVTDEGPEAVDDDAVSPEQSAARRQARARLDEILDGMSLERRAVFVMFEVDAMSCDEIAATIGAPLGTVYSRLHAARQEFEQGLRRMQARARGAR